MAEIEVRTYNKPELKKWNDPNFWEEVRFVTFGVFVVLFLGRWVIHLFG